MKTKKTYIIFFAVSILLSVAMKCEKENLLDEDGLPRATQTGAMVFACKVNGENWISRKESRYINGGIRLELQSVHGTKISDTGFEIIEIQIENPGNHTKFHLNGSEGRFALYRTDRIYCCDEADVYGLCESKSTDGEVIFTRIDSEKKIISGTFWCDIPTDKCGVLKVTHGRFDIRYR